MREHNTIMIRLILTKSKTEKSFQNVYNVIIFVKIEY